MAVDAAANTDSDTAIFPAVASGAPTLLDSYSETNQDAVSWVYNGRYRTRESFPSGSGGTLNSAIFFMLAAGNPTSNAADNLYSHSGTYGTSSIGNTLLVRLMFSMFQL